MAVGFSSEEWKTLSTNDLVRRCRDLSAEAQMRAIDARAEGQVIQVREASEWLKLAKEIEKYAQEDGEGDPGLRLVGGKASLAQWQAQRRTK